MIKKYSKFTVNCKYCNKEFKVTGVKDPIYCSDNCKQLKGDDLKKLSRCVVCENEFSHYGEAIICGKVCAAKYFSENNIGENYPDKYNKQKRKCVACKKLFSVSKSGTNRRDFCSLACSHGLVIDVSEVKQEIRTRDGYKCQFCGIEENDKKHRVHHINGDKKNLDCDNLLTLCDNCYKCCNKNDKTFWEIVFSGMASASKVVKKDWGVEVHIANHNEYCLKYLIFFKGKQFSHHYHELKKELWHCVCGKFECVLEKDGVKQIKIFKQGQKIEIEPTVVHQLQALSNSILVEVSTKDYPEDSFRICSGHNF
jgi:mannose-6-phosphate isomerase-like protein (cupin superfamily)